MIVAVPSGLGKISSYKCFQASDLELALPKMSCTNSSHPTTHTFPPHLFSKHFVSLSLIYRPVKFHELT